ncbi:hypothetical protein RJ40_00600 [Methanofollis aquaemaris]|uniref:Uncharacterized protein n=1 Tax=Methanofollis aquaemaris TaxID=126734 RepID=A0A8A3S390_9EURY|nr:hypothetical protein [Methanofollis aquaemaris]QSZ66106.1 hypothetical protein RJ40_00600 [Methanofollis aquaemaris]
MEEQAWIPFRRLKRDLGTLIRFSALLSIILVLIMRWPRGCNRREFEKNSDLEGTFSERGRKGVDTCLHLEVEVFNKHKSGESYGAAKILFQVDE